MKNKIIGIVISLIVMIGMVASNVNAATLSADRTEVNKGEEVVVTVNLENETQAIQLKLTYDASKFEYVKGSASSSLGTLTVNDLNEGEVVIAGSNPTVATKSVSFKFIAKENTESAEFKASDLLSEDDGFTVDTVAVKVVEPTTEEPTPDPEPTTPQDPDQPIDNNQNANETNSNAQKVDDEGNVITKLPQTGVNVYQVLAGVAVVAIVVALVARKIRK